MSLPQQSDPPVLFLEKKYHLANRRYNRSDCCFKCVFLTKTAVFSKIWRENGINEKFCLQESLRMGEDSPWLQPRLGLPHTPTAGFSRQPATPGLSSRPCAGITTPDLNRFIKMFAPRAISHANKITLFHCLLSKTPLSAKKLESGFGFTTLIAGTCKNQVLRKPCD